MTTETITDAAVTPSLPRRAVVLLPFHVVLYALVATFVFFMVKRDISDPDLWWHLRNAEYVWLHHSFPLHDIYSFTARGAAWVPHEWLGEMVLYAGFRIAGLRGVFTVTLILSELIFLGMLYLCHISSGNIKSAFLVTAPAVLLGTVSLGPRTLLLGWVWLVLLLILLVPLRQGRPAKLWAIPPLFLVWVNSHGSWFMGLMVLVIVVGCGLFEFSYAQVEAKAYSRPHIGKLLFTLAASVCALFVTPVGYRLLMYPFEVRLLHKISLENIQEWASVNFHNVLGALVIGLLFAIFASTLFSRRKWRLEEVVLVCLAVYFTLTYVRMIFLSAILVPPILVTHLMIFEPYSAERDKPIFNAVLVAFCILLISVKWPTPALLDSQIAKFFPIKAVEYIKSNPPRGNLFNDYRWGGYLIWAARDIPVFIDGRADIYEYTGVFRDYLDVALIKDTFKALDKHNIDEVLVQTETPLAYLLRNSNNWTPEYSDNLSVVFRRSGNGSPSSTKVLPANGNLSK